ncbi:hypothetical protein [Clostridium beijerinckii]|uniref:DUF8042 domain-containing protein n=1 Tax=Clostridium beijerinckii TaxID=1520 RepID=A0A1S8S662_CLOBE|nr:hypothetical protein [Clostridium beijerinckii]NRY60067.1 hypothetical protein [Clostridium beijerinckii]OOM60923.1 hypothetical protein CLBCK_26400 [Clostridium beijerinckii]
MDEEMDKLKTVLNRIDKLECEIEKTSTLFINGNLGEGNKNISLIMDGIQWVIETINMIKDNGENIIQTQELNPKLIQLLDSYENGDYILIGDIFLYEVLPVIREWKQLLGLHENK